MTSGMYIRVNLKGINCWGVNKINTKPTWEFYDLENDPFENSNEINNPEYKSIITNLRNQLIIEKRKVKDYELEIPAIWFYELFLFYLFL